MINKFLYLFIEIFQDSGILEFWNNSGIILEFWKYSGILEFWNWVIFLLYYKGIVDVTILGRMICKMVEDEGKNYNMDKYMKKFGRL